MAEGTESLFEGMESFGQGFGDASTVVPACQVVVVHSVTVH